MNNTENGLFKRINLLCEEKNIEKNELASRSALPLETIEKILKGEYVPTVHELVRMARVLGIRPGTLLDDHEQIGPVVNRGALSPSEGLNALASKKAGRQMEPFLITLKKDQKRALSAHEGEEFLFIIEGEVKLSYGNEQFILSRGDSIYYDSVVNHCLNLQAGDTAQVLAILFDPQRGTNV